MAYQILSPVNMAIDADTFYDAVKKFVKNSRDFSINQLIIADAMKQQMKVDLNYYKVGDRNKFNAKFYNHYPSNRYPIRNNYYPNGPLLPMGMPLVVQRPKIDLPDIEAPEYTNYPSTTTISKDTFLPSGTVIVDGTIIMVDSVIEKGTYLPKGIYLPQGILLSSGTEITSIPRGGLYFDKDYDNKGKTDTKYGVKFGSDSFIPKGTFFPEGTIIKNNTIIKKGSIIKRGTTFPAETIFKATDNIAAGTTHVDGTIIKDSVFKGIIIPRDTIIGNGSVIKIGTIIPTNTVIPEGNEFEIKGDINNTQLDTGTTTGFTDELKTGSTITGITFNNSLTEKYTIKAGTKIIKTTKITKDFKWTVDSELGDGTVISQTKMSKPSSPSTGRFIVPTPSILVPGTFPGIPDVMRLPTMMQPRMLQSGMMYPGMMQPGMMRQQPRMAHIPSYRK